MVGTLSAVAIALSLPSVAGAQSAAGVVTDSTFGQPIGGAVVSVLDSAGSPLVRTIADGAGRFVLALGPGATRLHVIRIGYFPRDVKLFAGGTGTVRLSVVMSRIPPVLNAMRTSDTEICPGSQDRGAAFQLWQQARDGLLAAVVARDTKPADFTMLVFQRQAATADSLVLQQQSAIRQGHRTRPFVAAEPPSTFVERGYVDEDSGGVRTYNAPDADVLLDDSFAATHCFHLQAPDAHHPGQNGIAFTPAPGRDSLADVAGVLWMDATEPALRSLDFHYTGIEPAAEKAGVGGHVEFRSMSNGVPFIDWWKLRLPALGREMREPPRGPAPRDKRPRPARDDYRVMQLLENGGAVVSAAWTDGTSWRAQPTGLTGQVTQSGVHAPVPFAIVTLVGTADSATADARGRYSLAPVAPGRYTVTVADTALSRFAAIRVASRVTDIPRDSLVQLDQSVEPLAKLIGGLCSGQRVPKNASVILGRFGTTGSDVSVSGAEVRATWNYLAAQTGSAVSVGSADQRSSVDDQGRFVICGAGRGQSVHLHATWSGLTADTTIVASESTITSLDWSATVPPATPLARPPGSTLCDIVTVNPFEETATDGRSSGTA